ncbi:MAG TPA: HAD family phosphatase [Candidatus Acidoferrales bacterium]
MSKTSRPTNQPEIRAIIFDIGRVIIALDPRRAIDAIGAGSALAPDKLWAAVQNDPLWMGWQEGRVTPREWYENLIARFHTPISFDEFCNAWNSVLVPKLILPESLFKQLSKKCRLVLLSNTDPIHVRCIESKFPFVRYFPKRIYSCEVGASKPGPKIFRAAIKAAGVPAKQILFIDDVRENVMAARRVGLRALQFRSRRRLEADLRRLRLLP